MPPEFSENAKCLGPGKRQDVALSGTSDKMDWLTESGEGWGNATLNFLLWFPARWL